MLKRNDAPPFLKILILVSIVVIVLNVILTINGLSPFETMGSSL